MNGVGKVVEVEYAQSGVRILARRLRVYQVRRESAMRLELSGSHWSATEVEAG